MYVFAPVSTLGTIINVVYVRNVKRTRGAMKRFQLNELDTFTSTWRQNCVIFAAAVSKNE